MNEEEIQGILNDINEINDSMPDIEETKPLEEPQCFMCKNKVDLSYEDPEGHAICQTCYHNNYFMCAHCDSITSQDSQVTINRLLISEYIICEDCFNNGDYRYCEQCGNAFDEEHFNVDLDGNQYCRECEESGHGNFADEEEPIQNNRTREFRELLSLKRLQCPHLDTRTKEFQNNKNGSIITDRRLFSAELECYYPNNESFESVINQINKKFVGTGLTYDGSLNKKGDNNGVEFQTPLLGSAKGQKYIEDLTKLFKDNNFYVNVLAGTHIHLDGKGFTQESLFTEEEVMYKKIEFFFNYQIDSSEYRNGIDSLRKFTRKNDQLMYRYPHGLTKLSDIDSFDTGGMTADQIRKQRAIDTEYLSNLTMSKESRKENIMNIIRYLKNALYEKNEKNLEKYDKFMSSFLDSRLLSKITQLFTVYYFADEIIMQFLPHSRRNNKYCLPLWREFNIKEIDSIRTMQEFESMWYQSDDNNSNSSRKGDPKDISRRHGANFHILLCQGHFELRYHSGTINADKILYWVQFNQALMNLADTDHMNFSAIRQELEGIRYIQNLGIKRRKYYKLLGLTQDAIDYWESRATKFAGDDELAEIPKEEGNSQDL